MKHKIAGLVALGLLTVGLVNAANAPLAAPSITDTATPTPVEIARRTGKPVDVPELSSETTRILANPEGTFTAEIHSRPTFARKGDVWVPIDTNLASTADGGIGPIAAAPLTFSNGGTAPLVQLRDKGGNSLTLRWAGELPKPTLDGDTATYANVFPGVDLVMRATGTGFSETLVVKTAKAAKNPALKKVKLALTTKGLTVRADGSISDRSGAVVFTSPPAFMWDSSAGTVRVDRAKEPQTGDRVAAVSAKWTAKALTIAPDLKMLADPKTTFPVYIDPTVETKRVHWTMITEEYPTYAWWDTNWRGRVGAVSDGTAATPRYYRSYYQQDVAAVAGTRIINATFYLSSVWSSSCTARPIQIWETGPISPITTWLTQPAMVRKVAEKSDARGFSSQCDPGKIPFDITSLVQQAANAGKSDITMAVRSAETDPNTAGGFEIHNAGDTSEFPKDPFISITYNTMPAAPKQVTTQEIPCAGTGAVISGGSVATRNPTLSAWLDDVDGLKGQTVAAQFEWQYPNGVRENGVTTGQYAPGKLFTTTVTENLNEGKHQWRVRADDGSDQGPWSPWCEITVDVIAPSNAPAVNQESWSIQAFQPTSFTFSAEGDTDVVKFRYTMDGQGTQEVRAAAPGGTATVQIAAIHSGPNFLEVSSVDAAGWTGPVNSYYLQVEDGPGVVAEWKLDAPDGDRAPDTNGGAPAAINGNATWQGDGREGGSMRFDGGHLSTDATVLQTDSSYTVMAWVKLDDLSTWHTAVSQDGEWDSGFVLQYSGYTRRWEFGMGSDDTNGEPAVKTFLSSDAYAQRGVWTHIAGVNDRENNELRLYVNGRLTGTMTSTIARPAVGALHIGRGQNDGSQVWQWAGQIDEVRVYQKAVSEFEIRHVTRPDPHGPEGVWNFDEGTGIVAADSSNELNHLAIDSGAGTSWVDGYRGKALHFNNSESGYAYSAGPLLDTAKSFTVGAWVRPADLNIYPVAISQDGGIVSAFTLGYNSYPQYKWSFSMIGKDTWDNPGGATAMADWTHRLDLTNVWTHLAGVYDAQAHELRLYVNGKLASTVAHTSTWSAPRAFQVGRAMNNYGYHEHFWNGDIDEVHAVQQAMTEAEIGEWVKPAKFGPNAEWHLDSGTSMLDDSTENDHRLWLRTGVTTSTDGVVGSSLKFSGEGEAFANTAGPIMDTTKSFAVSSWSRLEANDHNRNVMVQDGRFAPGFAMLYDSSIDRYTFTMPKSDAESASIATAQSNAPPVLNSWTHLLGVYDSVRGEMKLYVNGQLNATTTHRSTWSARGSVILGRGKWNGFWLDYWKGNIDEVKVLDHVPGAEEIAGLTKLPPPPTTGSVRFENTYSHQCLTDRVADTADGWVVQRDCREVVTGYALEAYSDGTYRIYASHPKYGTGCLGVAGGAIGLNYQVQDGLCQDNLGQRVRFEPVALPVPGYRIRFVHSNQCIGIYAKSGEQDIFAIQTDCSASDPTQVFELKNPNAPFPALGPPPKEPRLGKVIINPAHSDKCLGEKTTASSLANWWRLNNPLAGTTLDMAGTKPGVNENITWSLDSQRGVVGTFNGTSSVIKWDASPVDTTKSFTYATWIRLNDKAQDRYTWVIAGGLGDSAVKLRYEKAGDRWHLEGTTRVTGQTANTWWHVTTAAGVPQAGAWSHLAVVADAATKTIKLFVNGVNQGSTTVTTPFNNAATYMRIGDQYGSSWFSGYLSDMQAYQGVLADAEVEGIYSSTDGNVYQGPCTGASPEYSLAKASGYWLVKVKHPLFGAGCMGVYGTSTTAGTKVRDVQCGSGDQIYFKLEAVTIPTPGYRIRSASSELCLGISGASMADWTQLVQMQCDYTAKNQVFKLQELEVPAELPKNREWKIRSLQSGLCLSEKPSTPVDVRIYQTYCANTNPVFKLEQIYADSNYAIKATDSTNGTACMGVQGAAEEDQAQLADIYPCGAGKHQRFNLESVNAPVAGYRLHVAHTGMCVAVRAAALTDWAQVVQEACDDAKKSQVFAFDDPNAPPPPAPSPSPTPAASPTPAPSPTPTVAPAVSAYGSCENTGFGWGVYLSGSISNNPTSVSSASASWNASGVDSNYGPPSGSTSLSVSSTSFSGNIPPQSGREFVGGSGVSWTVTVTLANGQSYSTSGYTSRC